MGSSRDGEEIRTRTRVPLSGPLSISSVPPRSSARSRMDFRPRWPGETPVGSKPAPSSLMASVTSPLACPTLRPTLAAYVGGPGVSDRVAGPPGRCGRAPPWSPSATRGPPPKKCQTLISCLAYGAAACFSSAETRPSGLSSKMRARISARPASDREGTYSSGYTARAGSRSSRVRAMRKSEVLW